MLMVVNTDLGEFHVYSACSGRLAELQLHTTWFECAHATDNSEEMKDQTHPCKEICGASRIFMLSLSLIPVLTQRSAPQRN